jgi:transcriptional regulator with XRE-family HTH domain
MPRSRYRSSRAVPKLRVQLAARLREVRHTRGLSQTRVGELAGLSGKFIGEVERGDKSVSIDSLYRVAVVLKVSLRDLLGDDAKNGPRSPADDIFRLLAGRSNQQLRRAREAVARMFGRSR